MGGHDCAWSKCCDAMLVAVWSIAVGWLLVGPKS